MTAFRVTIPHVAANDLSELLSMLLDVGWDVDVELASTPSGGSDVDAAGSPATTDWQANTCPKCGAPPYVYCESPSGTSYGYGFHHAGRG